jgi:prepilin-type N-terminal cleavage/methylation domain-containing protein
MGKQQRVDDGFTIIEIMIVLAIAGLMMLIVFLAVPALQRSARNNDRKIDAAAIAGGVSEFITNNGGIMPDHMRTDVLSDGTLNNKALDLGYTYDCGPQTSSSYYKAVSLNFYNVSRDPEWGQDAGPDQGVSADFNVGAYISCPSYPIPTTPTVIAADNYAAISWNKINTESISVITGESCNATGTAAGSLDQQSFAVFYVLESGSGNGNLECLDQ